MPREIKVYYEVWTPDDQEQGQASERGEQTTLDCEPDEFDKEDGISAVDLAFDKLRNYGPFEPSSWPDFHEGIWYSDIDGSLDFRTGDRTLRSYHPCGFSEDEQRQLFDRLTAKG